LLFVYAEILIGTEIGTGEFGVVSEVDILCPHDDDCDCYRKRDALPLAAVFGDATNNEAATSSNSISGSAHSILQSLPQNIPPSHPIVQSPTQVTTGNNNTKGATATTFTNTNTEERRPSA
jgi:hypothetical protein